MIIIFSISILLTTQIAYAQVDPILDCDGTASAMTGCPASQEVTAGDTLTPFPTLIPPGLPGVPKAGIDWFDRDNSRTWTTGDDFHSEDPETCTTSSPRNGFHTPGDCPILDLDGNLGSFMHPGGGFGGDIVDCDLETGGSPSGGGAAMPAFGFPPSPPPCQDIRPTVLITFFDSNSK